MNEILSILYIFMHSFDKLYNVNYRELTINYMENSRSFVLSMVMLTLSPPPSWLAKCRP